MLAARWLGSLLIVGLPAAAFLLLVPGLNGWTFWAIYAGVWAVLLVIAHFVEFRPDEGDLGLFGLPIDNPSSIRDDVNRDLMFLRAVFVPINIVMETICDTVGLLR